MTSSGRGADEREDLLPHHLGDAPDALPRSDRTRPIWLGPLLAGLGGLLAYQALLIAAAAPLSGWAPLSTTATATPPENLEAALMWALSFPYALASYALVRQLPGEAPRSAAGALFAALLWLAPFYYPPVLTPATGLDSFLGAAYHASPALWGGLAGGIVADAVSGRPKAGGLWAVWESVAPVAGALLAVILVYDSPATRPLLGPGLLAACALSGVLAGLAGRGGAHALVAAVGCSLAVLLQGPYSLGLAFGPGWEDVAAWALPALPPAIALPITIAYRARLRASRARR